MKTETVETNFRPYLNRRVQTPIDCKTLWRTRRSQFIGNRFLERLTEAIRRDLGIAAIFSWLSSPPILMLPKRPVARIELRAYQHSIYLFLPVELLSDLSTALGGEPLCPITHSPGERELTAIGYAMARTLSADGLFVHHRVVLSGILILNEQGERDDEEKIFANDSEANEWHYGSVEVKAFRTSYAVHGILPRQLYERLNHYSRLFLDCAAYGSLLARAKVTSTLHLAITFDNFLDLLTRKGERPFVIVDKTVRAMLATEDSQHFLPLQVIGADEQNQLLLRGQSV